MNVSKPIESQILIRNAIKVSILIKYIFQPYIHIYHGETVAIKKYKQNSTEMIINYYNTSYKYKNIYIMQLK